MIYLASPYTSVDHWILQMRFIEACRAAAWLLRKEIWTFSPIVHTHPLVLEQSHVPFEFWEAYDREMISCSKGLVVLAIEGWRRSRGVAAEIEIAREFGLPLFLMKPVALATLSTEYTLTAWDGVRHEIIQVEAMTIEEFKSAISERPVQNASNEGVAGDSAEEGYASYVRGDESFSGEPNGEFQA